MYLWVIHARVMDTKVILDLVGGTIDLPAGSLLDDENGKFY